MWCPLITHLRSPRFQKNYFWPVEGLDAIFFLPSVPRPRAPPPTSSHPPLTSPKRHHRQGASGPQSLFRKSCPAPTSTPSPSLRLCRATTPSPISIQPFSISSKFAFQITWQSDARIDAASRLGEGFWRMPLHPHPYPTPLRHEEMEQGGMVHLVLTGAKRAGHEDGIALPNKWQLNIALFKKNI